MHFFNSLFHLSLFRLIERAREASLNIDGKVKSSEGGSYAKTYINQLACITGVTDATARAIAQEYPTWRLLLDAYKRCVSEHDKKVLLDGIAVCLQICSWTRRMSR